MDNVVDSRTQGFSAVGSANAHAGSLAKLKSLKSSSSICAPKRSSGGTATLTHCFQHVSRHEETEG